jgi:hypothetical protein
MQRDFKHYNRSGMIDKEMAREILNNFMKKHDLNESDVKYNIRNDFFFKIPEEERKAFKKIATAIIGKHIKFYISQVHQEFLIVECSVSEAFEIEIQLEAYKTGHAY